MRFFVIFGLMKNFFYFAFILVCSCKTNFISRYDVIWNNENKSFIPISIQLGMLNNVFAIDDIYSKDGYDTFHISITDSLNEENKLIFLKCSTENKIVDTLKVDNNSKKVTLIIEKKHCIVIKKFNESKGYKLCFD